MKSRRHCSPNRIAGGGDERREIGGVGRVERRERRVLRCAGDGDEIGHNMCRLRVVRVGNEISNLKSTRVRKSQISNLQISNKGEKKKAKFNEEKRRHYSSVLNFLLSPFAFICLRFGA